MPFSPEVKRVYPLRLTKDSWEIPILCTHACNERCAKIFVRHEEHKNMYRLMANPEYKNGKCSLHNKTVRSAVSLHNYSLNTIYGLSGPIYNPSQTVIPDKEFTVCIDYPLSEPVFVGVTAEEPFKLSEIIFILKTLYQNIYEREEQTATPTNFKIKKVCKGCIQFDFKDHISYVVPSSVDKDCPICYTNYSKEEQITELNCKHKFHTHCIMNWAENSPTCPMCRANIIQCEKCKSTGFIFEEYTGAVIPAELREDTRHRNRTDGVFGIYGYDFEDLTLEQMFYDRITKHLHISIGC